MSFRLSVCDLGVVGGCQQSITFSDSLLMEKGMICQKPLAECLEYQVCQ